MAFERNKLVNFIYNNSDDIVIVLSPQACILDFNKQAEKVFNWQYTSILYENFADVCEKNHITFPIQDLNTVLLKKNKIKTSSYLKIAEKLHKIFWTISDTENSYDVSRIILITGHDISDYNEANNADKNINSYFETVIHNVPHTIFWKDKNSVYLGCNKTFSDSAGLSSPKDIVGMTDYDLPWTRSETKAYIEDDREVMRTKMPKLNIEEPQTSPDGTKIVLLTSKVPLFDEQNKVIGVLGIYTNITERKRIEEDLRVAKEKAEAANKAKTEFIANMSHDIRTPMSGVIGMAKILEVEGANLKDREYGHIIHTSSERLLRLLNDILEVISAEEIRKEHLIIEAFSLKERIQHLQDLILPTIQSNNIKWIINTDPEIPEYVLSDRVKFDRILLNLASNALKFTPQGEIVVSSKLLFMKKKEIEVEITIRDTGIGIAPDQIDKIFERFYRISPTYENQYSGHGIGLFIVQKYVSLLDGTISVESIFGEGTTFKIRLPMKIGKKPNVRTVAESKVNFELDNLALKFSQLNQPLNKKYQGKEHSDKMEFKALLIEDDRVARLVATSVLQGAGFEIDAVETAEDGFKKVLEKSYDLIITDIGLPGMSGNEFTEMTRFWEKKTHHEPIPIIGLTAHGKQQTSVAKSVGMNDLLIKPIDEFKVRRIIERFFTKQKDLAEKFEQKKGRRKKKIGLGPDLPDTEEALFLLDQYPLFDELDGIEKAAGSRELLVEILGLLTKNTIPEELENLEKAYAIPNWKAIESIAHKLKGGALYCGTVRMRYACQYMERYLLAGHSKLLEELYQQLIKVLMDTKSYVVQWLSESHNK